MPRPISEKIRALVLFSGGLDSTLAAKVLEREGVEVTLIFFQLPFYPRDFGQDNEAIKRRAADLGWPIIVVPAGELMAEYWPILRDPAHGYGRQLNPCQDCHLFMCRQAKKYLAKTGASFLATGEVLGQRPKSQHLDSLNGIVKESGLEGLILRPLSARLLPPTVPEEKGWVRREGLYDFSGRWRQPQERLAAELGITDYPNPAGGCLLTEKVFSGRLADLLEHRQGDPTLAEIYQLKIGRHFRLSDQAKLIVGRDEKENDLLLGSGQSGALYFEPSELMGPSGLGQGFFSEEQIVQAGRLVARWCDQPADDPEREKPVGLKYFVLAGPGQPAGEKTLSVGRAGKAEAEKFAV